MKTLPGFLLVLTAAGCSVRPDLARERFLELGSPDLDARCRAQLWWEAQDRRELAALESLNERHGP